MLLHSLEPSFVFHADDIEITQTILPSLLLSSYAEMQKSFKQAGFAVPPWRWPCGMLTKWLPKRPRDEPVRLPGSSKPSRRPAFSALTSRAAFLAPPSAASALRTCTPSTQQSRGRQSRATADPFTATAGHITSPGNEKPGPAVTVVNYANSPPPAAAANKPRPRGRESDIKRGFGVWDSFKSNAGFKGAHRDFECDCDAARDDVKPARCCLGGGTPKMAAGEVQLWDSALAIISQ